MRPIPADVFTPEEAGPARDAARRERVVEAAPARGRIRALALVFSAVLLVLAGRAAQVALTGPPPSATRVAGAEALGRAALTDRNGVLLATEGVGYTLAAQVRQTPDPAALVDALRGLYPHINRTAVLARFAEPGRRSVDLVRELTREQADRALDLALPGLVAFEEPTRLYPQGALAGHLLGYTDVDEVGLAGLERGWQARLTAAGGTHATSLDLRAQHALEAELAAAAQATGADAAASILVDGRTGEVLALASWPAFDPNRRSAFSGPARRNHAVNARYEMGSTIKPLTFAMGLDAGVYAPGDLIETRRPIRVEGRDISDPHPADRALDLDGALARSSNIAAAVVALRLGRARQQVYLERLGLAAAAPLPLPESAAPLMPAATRAEDVAVRGFGHGVAFSVAALAQAYTIFVNEGARTALTLEPRPTGIAGPLTPVVSPQAARQVLAAMGRVVEVGTGRLAAVPGLSLAGKTGTAELPHPEGGYDPDRVLATFAAVFPAEAPRYVLIVAFEDPRRGLDAGAGATGGGVAAPAAARTLNRIAPFLGLRVQPGAARAAAAQEASRRFGVQGGEASP